MNLNNVIYIYESLFSVLGLIDFPPINIQKAAAINGLKILSIISSTTMEEFP